MARRYAAASWNGPARQPIQIDGERARRIGSLLGRKPTAFERAEIADRLELCRTFTDADANAALLKDVRRQIRALGRSLERCLSDVQSAVGGRDPTSEAVAHATIRFGGADPGELEQLLFSLANARAMLARTEAGMPRAQRGRGRDSLRNLIHYMAIEWTAMGGSITISKSGSDYDASGPFLEFVEIVREVLPSEPTHRARGAVAQLILQTLKEARDTEHDPVRQGLDERERRKARKRAGARAASAGVRSRARDSD